ncbi:HNH endonuclease [Pseudidiomarina salinarum]|uniref:HNH endonuclease n=1 Tax=Pseudidiomarina salinarum TaxID=435908 RepID=UPI0006912EE7|nr:HNH endonuclease [Pseudidiomarina salinarum]RUO70093.1 HNH endonuclease [Pseudidiomarina salinarum]
MQLDEQGKNLLSLLVLRLDDAVPGRPDTYIGYKDCHDLLNLPKIREKWGESLKAQGLNSLAAWTAENNVPAITGLIIDKSSLEPGPGYFSLFGEQINPYQWWESEVRRSKSYDWSSFVNESFNLIPSDIDVPDREDIVVSRIIRDTALSQRVKRLNNYECQFCGTSIEMPQGKKYAEAHHIKPLGSPHNGPDVVENMVCVCPNHHAMLDYGAITIDVTKLKSAGGYIISNEFIQYHNENIHKP